MAPSGEPSGGTVHVNPYRLVGQVAEGDRFIGRAHLLRRVRATWAEPGRPANLRVLGHHRVGKTSLVRRALGTAADRPDLTAVVINVGTCASGDDMFRSMVRSVMEQLEDAPGVDGALAAIGSGVQMADGWYDLKEGVRAFFKAVRKAGRHVLLVLDEFDRAAGVAKPPDFQLLRDLASEPEFPLGLITVSRRPIEVIESAEAASQAGSILGAVVINPLYVGMFTDEEADLMLARAASAGIGLASVRDEIVDRTGLHPFLLELMCNRVVQAYAETGKVDVAACYESEAIEFHAQFDRLIGNIDADTGGNGSALLRRIAAGAPGIQPSADLSRLIQMGVVSRTPEGGLSLFSREFGRHVLTLGEG